MQKRKSTVKVKSLLGILSLLLFVDMVWADAGWTSYGKVTEVLPTTAGRFLVQLDVEKNPSAAYIGRRKGRSKDRAIAEDKS